VLAGFPVAVSIFGPTPVQSFTSTAVATPGTSNTITITLNPQGQTAFGGRIQSLGFAGPNAADFAIVAGGTCTAGSTVLSPITLTTGQSCTVNVRYTPSSAALESAFLTASCQPVALIGGFVVSCTGVLGNIASLAGSILALVSSTAAIPTLSPMLLGVMAALVFVVGETVALRRR